ncbi:MAG: ribonuclease P protein component [Erysipelotrichaceae bacterium]|nr:ribonuclease P protein component [Erysipelotrichaceae bacterium]
MNRRFRIRKNREFSKIMSCRKSVSGSCFVVYFSDRAQDVARVGISVSKKIGNAVTRNRVKRQVREMARSLIDFETCPKDIVVIVKKPYLDNDFADNKNDLEKALKKAII